MILDKEIEVKIIQTKYYREKGYNVKSGDIVKIPINDLPLKSDKIVNVECDICGKKYQLPYKKANQNISRYNFLSCKKCSSFKSKLTKKEKYGDENYNNYELINKTKKERYNDENYNNREKAKETCKEKYGRTHHNKNKEIKNKIKLTKKERYNDENYNNQEKYVKTCKIKYNVNCYMKTNDFKEKSKLTKKERYNDENYNNQEKYIKTCKERYEYFHPMKNDKIKKKSVEKHKITIKNRNVLRYKDNNIIDYNNDKFIHKCEKGHISVLTRNMLRNRIKYNIPLCKKCYPTKESLIELKILNFIKKIYSNKIIRHERKEIGLELDIYIPDLKIAFEINGIYWHSTLFKEKYYHKNKLEKCINKNIRLIQIWENDWMNNYDDVIKMIKNIILNKEENIILNKEDKINPNLIDYRKIKNFKLTEPNLYYLKRIKNVYIKNNIDDGDNLIIYDSGDILKL